MDGVAIWDAAAFAKYEISGPGAEAWLAALLAGRMPKPGQVRLAPMLRTDGRLMGDLTLMRVAEDRWWIAGSYYLQAWHMRWFAATLPASGVVLSNISDATPALVLAGPRSGELLAALGGDPGLRFMAVAAMDVAMAPTTVARVSLSGELSYEIHADAAYIPSIYRAAKTLGAEWGIRDMGYRAMLSMRLEKGFGIWSRDYSPDYTAGMSGLDRFVDFERADFTGRDAALAERDVPPARRLALLEIAATDSDANGYEPIWSGAQLVGFVTSGGYGHRTGKSLALAYLDRGLPADTTLTTDLLGERRAATLLAGAAYDPAGTRMRA